MNSEKIIKTLDKIAIEEAFFYVGPGEHPNPEAIAASQALEMSYFQNRWDRLQEFDTRRIEAMNQDGVQFQVLSHNAPATQGIIDPALAKDRAKELNDFLAARIQEHPDRFLGFAALSMHDGEVAAKELERSVSEHGFVGALINGFTDTNNGTLYMDDPRYESLWQAMESLDVPLYIHPRSPGGDWSALHGQKYLQGATWGFAPETASHLLRIIFSGVLDRHPKLKIVVGHLGENLPAALGRIQHYFTQNPYGHSTERTLQEYFSSNVHVSTSGNFNDQALITALLTMGADNILFAVDYPFSENGIAGKWIDSSPISEKDRKKIKWNNAVDLLNLKSKGILPR